MRLHSLFATAALLLGAAQTANAQTAKADAASLRLYPSFAEVRQTAALKGSPAGLELRFSRSVWASLQPGSLGLSGAGATKLLTRPTDRDWLTSQVGKPVTVLRAGQAGLTGKLIRAEDPVVQLDSGGSLAVQPTELVFSETPPVGWQGGVVARFEMAGPVGAAAEVSYRTNALSWTPRYELSASGTQAGLAALAEIRNIGEERYTADEVELYAGEVRNVNANAAQVLQSAAAGTSPTSAGAVPLPVAPLSNVASTGELRGLQRYALPGGLKLGRGETLTVPFVRPRLTDFIRYDTVTTYFDAQPRSGSASRHSKFTPDLALPAGPISVREEGRLVGTVNLPASQPGRAIDLDLGPDSGLRYARTVKQVSQDRNPAGKVLSTTYRVSFTLTSTREQPVRVNVAEQVYGRGLVVDGQPQSAQQIRVERRVNVQANGTATLGFTLKIQAN